jgi:hypothetical protein
VLLAVAIRIVVANGVRRFAVITMSDSDVVCLVPPLNGIAASLSGMTGNATGSPRRYRSSR